jgi:hypothetical protein
MQSKTQSKSFITVKLGYNDRGYNELTATTNKVTLPYIVVTLPHKRSRS